MNSAFDRSIDRDAHDYQQASQQQKDEIDRIRAGAERRKEDLRREQDERRETDIQKAAEKLSPSRPSPELHPPAQRRARANNTIEAEREVNRANQAALALIDREARQKTGRILADVRREKGIDHERETIGALREQKREDRQATRIDEPRQEPAEPEQTPFRERVQKAYRRATERTALEREQERDTGRQR